MSTITNLQLLPPVCNDWQFQSKINETLAKDGLTKLASDEHGTRYVLTAEFVELGLITAVKQALDQYPDLRGKVLVVSPDATRYLQLNPEGELESAEDFWRCLLKVTSRKPPYEHLGKYEYIIVPYGGTKYQWHWSLLWVTNPFSEKAADRGIFHCDSLLAGHDTQQLAKALTLALGWLRQEMDKDVVSYRTLRLPTPTQPEGCNACGLFVICNASHLLHQTGSGSPPLYRSETNIAYDPVLPLLFAKHNLLPLLEPVTKQSKVLESLADSVTCPFEIAANDHGVGPVMFFWPDEYGKEAAHKAGEWSRLGMPGHYKARSTRANSQTHSHSKTAGASPQHQSKRAKQSGDTSSEDITMATGELDDEVQEMRDELDELISRGVVPATVEDDFEPPGTAGRASTTKKRPRTRKPTPKRDKDDVDQLEQGLEAWLGEAATGTTDGSKVMQALMTISVGVQNLTAETRKTNGLLQRQVTLLEEQKAEAAIEKAKADHLSDDSIQDGLYPMVRMLFIEDPYPQPQVIAGVGLEFLSAQSFDEVSKKMDGTSKKTAQSAMTLLKTVKSKVNDQLRTNTRGAFRRAVVGAAKNQLSVKGKTCPKETGEAQLKGDAYIGGANPTHNTPSFTACLLAGYNFIHSSNLAELGAGGVPTEFFVASVAYVDMELRRWLANDDKSKPESGHGKGNKLAEKGEELRLEYTKRSEAFQKAQVGGTVTLEDAKLVKLVVHRNLGKWRKLGNTLTAKELAVFQK